MSEEGGSLQLPSFKLRISEGLAESLTLVGSKPFPEPYDNGDVAVLLGVVHAPIGGLVGESTCQTTRKIP